MVVVFGMFFNTVTKVVVGICEAFWVESGRKKEWGIWDVVGWVWFWF